MSMIRMTGTPEFARDALQVLRTLSYTRIPGSLVSSLTGSQLNEFPRIVESSDSKLLKARAFAALFRPGQVDLKDARKAVTRFSQLWQGLDRAGERKYELYMESEVASSLPRPAILWIQRILSTNFRNLFPQYDYSFVQGRSIYLNLPETIRVRCESFGQIKLKGVCFNADEDLKPFTSPVIYKTEFLPDGRILEQRLMPHKPTGAMQLAGAVNEFRLMDQAFKNGAKVVCPLGFGRFNDCNYKGEDLGFVVHALEGSETDLRSALASLVGEGRRGKSEYVMIVDASKVRKNKTVIEDLFTRLGKVYREFHDLDITQEESAHPGNILVGSNLSIHLPDFEAGHDLTGMPPMQNLAYRLNQIRHFMWYGFRLHMNDHFLWDFKYYYGLDIAKLFLRGYFYDRPEKDYGIRMLLHDQINDILAKISMGYDITRHPLVEDLLEAIGKKKGRTENGQIA